MSRWWHPPWLLRGCWHWYMLVWQAGLWKMKWRSPDSSLKWNNADECPQPARCRECSESMLRSCSFWASYFSQVVPDGLKLVSLDLMRTRIKHWKHHMNKFSVFWGTYNEAPHRVFLEYIKTCTDMLTKEDRQRLEDFQYFATSDREIHHGFQFWFRIAAGVYTLCSKSLKQSYCVSMRRIVKIRIILSRQDMFCQKMLRYEGSWPSQLFFGTCTYPDSERFFGKTCDVSCCRSEISVLCRPRSIQVHQALDQNQSCSSSILSLIAERYCQSLASWFTKHGQLIIGRTWPEGFRKGCRS